MAKNDTKSSAQKPSEVSGAEGAKALLKSANRGRKGSESESLRKSPPEQAREIATDSLKTVDLPTLLGRAPDEDEARGWATLSPSMREKAADRVALLKRWWGDRGGLSADDAAAIAEVTTKRFYQMASAWRKRPGLLAVGAYAAAKAERSSRLHPTVNALLQKHVVKAVASSDEDRTVEWIRRRLENMVKAELPARDGEGKELAIPSPNVVRAIIVREQNRVAETKLLGESIALDCCPVSLRGADGTPHAMFVVIDRGTLRIIGHAIGSIEASVEGYARAAASAIDWVNSSKGAKLPWASSARRADLVVGRDREASDKLIQGFGAGRDGFEFGPIVNERRFGSQFRKYVGERVGGVLLRPTWAKEEPPPLSKDDEVYDAAQAAERVSLEVQLYNASMPLKRSGATADAPPAKLLELLSYVAQ